MKSFCSFSSNATDLCSAHVLCAKLSCQRKKGKHMRPVRHARAMQHTWVRQCGWRILKRVFYSKLKTKQKIFQIFLICHHGAGMWQAEGATTPHTLFYAATSIWSPSILMGFTLFFSFFCTGPRWQSPEKMFYHMCVCVYVCVSESFLSQSHLQNRLFLFIAPF